MKDPHINTHRSRVEPRNTYKPKHLQQKGEGKEEKNRNVWMRV
jgi:hypothetical protein